jgi:hypothetical protein
MDAVCVATQPCCTLKIEALHVCSRDGQISREEVMEYVSDLNSFRSKLNLKSFTMGQFDSLWSVIYRPVLSTC